MSICTQTEKTDEQLVVASLSDAGQFACIILRYEKKLFRYVQRTLFVNKEDTEDILQEVFIKVYRNLNSFNPKYKFSSWIYRITYNECINHLRNHNHDKNQVNLEVESDTYNELIADINLESDAIKADKQKQVQHLLEQLDEKSRTVLILKYIEEKDYNEIADILETSTGNVGSLVNRAKSKFKKIIETN